MHRSHTSLIAQLLCRCGLYLGPDESFAPPNSDNQDGYFEDLRFHAINEALLAAYGGSWDFPPIFPEGWVSDPKTEAFRTQALSLIKSNSFHAPWGWKDPRTCLTLDFWHALEPDLKMVICLRSPVDVARSLVNRRADPLRYEEAVSLWERHYRDLLPWIGPSAVVVHVDSLFFDCASELMRICEFIGLRCENGRLLQACGAVRPELRRSAALDLKQRQEALPGSVQELYQTFCAEAGDLLAKALEDEQSMSARSLDRVENAHQRIRQLEGLLDDKNDEVIVKSAELRRALGELENARREVGQLRTEIDRIAATRWSRLGRKINQILRRAPRS